MLTLDVEKAAAGGRMLARHDGQVVLVAGAIPGERVVARVDRRAKGVLHAEVVDVLSASPDRRQPAYDRLCGGQVYAHIAYPRQLQLKAEIISDAFRRLARLPLAVLPAILGSPEGGYRMRARLHVRGHRIGFYREGTHEVCDPAPGGQLSAATTAWITEAEGTLQAHVLPGLAAIDLAENVTGDQRACHLELDPDADPAAFDALATGLVGLSAQVGDRGRVVPLAGVPVVSDVLHVREGDPGSALRLRRSARAFFQGNRFLLEPLARHVLARVPPGPVVDLYAGVGLFGLSLAASGFESVTLVEGDDVSGADLADNAEPFGDRVRVERTSVESFLSSYVRYAASGFSRTSSDVAPGSSRAVDTTVIIDPPRTGLSKLALNGLTQAQPERIIYVSCDVATLARDARAMTDAGYELQGITGFDLFPNTAHVESVAVMGRAGRSAGP